VRTAQQERVERNEVKKISYAATTWDACDDQRGFVVSAATGEAFAIVADGWRDLAG
jgi:hypothetical protein